MIFIVLLVGNLLFPFAAVLVVFSFMVSHRRRILLGLGSELRERFGMLTPEQKQKIAGREVLWIHAASAGEAGACAGLVARLRAGRPAAVVLMTTSTSAGRARAQNIPGVDLAMLAPLDFFLTTSWFISQVSPKILILIETELWPHLIELAHRRGARVALVNARISEKSFGRYRLLVPFLRPFLRRLEKIAAQTQADADRLIALGAQSSAVAVVGNLKYDLETANKDGEKAAKAIESLGWGNSPIFVAGSTHPVEEEAILEAYALAKATIADLKLVIAPRHVERAAKTEALLKEWGLRTSVWSRGIEKGADVLLIDVMGELSGFYGRARAAFVGGTLVPVGGHNLLEPALAGVPVFFGPHTGHIAQPARLLESAGGGFCVENGKSLGWSLGDLMKDLPRAAALGAIAKRAAQGLQGATDRTLAHIATLLSS